MTEIDATIDLDRYPIADPASPQARALVARGRAQLLDDGCFVLDGFIRADRIEDLAAEARALMVDGFYRSRERDPEEGRRSGCFAWHRTTRVSMRCVGGDRMDVDSPFLQIHRWDPLTRFIAAVLERETYFPSADPMVGAMLGAHQSGDELGWHYDPNDGVVTLMVQRCSGGGRFEFAPMNRPDDTSEAVQRDAIEAVMSGQWPSTRQLDQKPGDLTIFNGSRSLHRVTPVEAEPDRIMLLLSYDGRPDQVFSEDVHRDFFGRVASTR